jgi:hypothetical protein
LIKLKNFYIIPFLLLFFISCSEANKEDVQYRSIQLKQDIPLTEGGKDSTRYHIEFNIPQLVSGQNKNVMDEINFELNKHFFREEEMMIEKDPQKNFNRLIASEKEWYQKEVFPIKKKYPDLAGLQNYEFLKNGSVIYNKNNILSVACEVYNYTGGAHGINNMEFIHFDLNTGQQFDLDKLFDEQEKRELVKMVSNQCEEMKKAKDKDLFEESTIESCDNFYFDDDNFYFLYNPYEIGPYSAGYITIKISIKDIKPLIRKDIQPGFIH